MIPVVDRRDGSKCVMVILTPEAIERLQSGQMVDGSEENLQSVLGIRAVLVRFAESDAAAVQRVERMVQEEDPATSVRAKITNIDRTRRM